MKKKVLIVSEYLLYEQNGASYERILCYTKAMPEFDFIILQTDINYKKPIYFVVDREQENLFFIDGVFKTNGFVYRNSLKYFDIFRAYNLCRFITQKYKNDQVKILLYSSLLPIFYLVLFYLKEKMKFNVIIEKNELETGIIKNTQVPLNISFIFFIILFPFRFFEAYLIDYLTNKANKVIAISTRNRDKYYNKTTCNLIPLLVNTDRFVDKVLTSKNERINFIYLGFVTKSKDGISEILFALNHLKRYYSNFHLDIIGDGNRHYVKKVNNYIFKNNLQEIVTIKNSVQSKNVPLVLCDYDYGLLVRGRNTQTQYGFSTKLGEYLAAGLPVIFTDVSDNLLFLKDNTHGFLVPFPLHKNLTKILEKAILTDKDKKNKMEEYSRLLAKEKFDFRNYSEDLKFIFF